MAQLSPSPVLLDHRAHWQCGFRQRGTPQPGWSAASVVGQPSGPGALPFDYFKNRLGTTAWKSVPEAAQKAFPSVEQIMKTRVVRRAVTTPG
ncbi:MAG: hypothetical protein ACRDHF_00670 [Tepidiformaceae bacterium]